MDSTLLEKIKSAYKRNGYILAHKYKPLSFRPVSVKVNPFVGNNLEDFLTNGEPTERELTESELLAEAKEMSWL